MYLQKINLKNKYALVTGAGKGLGRACSIALAEAGATVVALSRTSSDLDKLEKEIKKIKGKIIKVTCDVMNYEDLKMNIEKIKIIDVLVNNAGTNIPEPFEKIKGTQIQQTIFPVSNIFASINSIVLAIQGTISLGIFKLVLLSAISSSVISNVSFTLGADFFLTMKWFL
ncbi:SDR family NAD(P)-dependent oxidoreductase [Candidatus Pelagibacter sp.]|nr:SDR family NAD(P)-dependent oxidoreductase [Candidatus Pelagibacter sp.]